jgi:hypothetical protein
LAERHVLSAEARVQIDPDLERLLAALSDPRVARSVRRGAINAAGQVVAKTARATAPRGRSGQLRESVRVRTKLRGDDVEGFVFAGSRYTVYRKGRATKDAYKNADGSYNAAFYAAFVERGTRPHWIPRTRVFGQAVAFGGRVRTQVFHPGARPVRYMANALAQTQGRIGLAMDTYIARRLQRLQRSGKAG